MKKSVFFLMLAFTLTIALPVEALAQHAGSANLHQINQSRIKAMLTFSDDGQTLQVDGVASGLDPTQAYVTLLYDLSSIPGGSRACLPTDNSLTFTQMVVGVWNVDGNGNGTLSAANTGAAYAPLATLGTISIRLDTQAGQPLPSAPDPGRFVLQACGKVRQ